MMRLSTPMLIVGYGTMTGAMVGGWLAAGYDSADFAVYHPTRAEAPHGLKVYNDWPDGPFGTILLGVKPHQLDTVAADVARVAGGSATILSVLAGVDLATLRARFPDAAGVVRVMPNLAVAINASPVVLAAQGLAADRRENVTALADALGMAEWLDDEKQFDLVTALAGSGPGFVYRFIDALAAAADTLGLPQDLAERLAVAMVQGAGALAAQSSYSPGALAKRVASPGGMTQRGLDVLDADGALQRLLTETLRATRDSGAELGTQAREQG